MSDKREVIIGEQFDDLTVVKYTGEYNRKGRAFVLCRCVCGNEITRVVNHLFTKGQFRKSCGCSRYKDAGKIKNFCHSRRIFNPLAQDFYLGKL